MHQNDMVDDYNLNFRLSSTIFTNGKYILSHFYSTGCLARIEFLQLHGMDKSWFWVAYIHGQVTRIRIDVSSPILCVLFFSLSQCCCVCAVLFSFTVHMVEFSHLFFRMFSETLVRIKYTMVAPKNKTKLHNIACIGCISSSFWFDIQVNESEKEDRKSD